MTLPLLSPSLGSTGSPASKIVTLALLSHILFKTTQTLSTLLYALGYFPEICQAAFPLAYLPALLFVYLFLLSSTSPPSYLTLLPQMHHVVTLSYSIFLQLATTLGGKDNGMDQERTHGTGLGVWQGSLLYSTLYILSHSLPSEILQYYNYCYPVHTLPYRYNIQNYTHQSTGQP